MSRAVLVAGIAVVTLSLAVGAQTTAPKALPLDNLGLEHLDIIVPDPGGLGAILRPDLQVRAASAARARHAALLRPARRSAGRSTGRLHRHRRGGQRQPAIGHYCVLAKVYDRAGMASALQGAGFGVAAAGPTGMWPDPDRLELQLFQPPAGLVTAAVPSPLPTERDGLLMRRAASITCCCASAVSRSRCRTTGWSTALRPNGHAMPTGASGFIWSATRVWVSKRRRQGRRRRSPTMRSRSRRSTAARSSAAAGAEGARASISGRARRRSLRRQQRHHRRGQSGAIDMAGSRSVLRRDVVRFSVDELHEGLVWLCTDDPAATGDERGHASHAVFA